MSLEVDPSGLDTRLPFLWSVGRFAGVSLFNREYDPDDNRGGNLEPSVAGGFR